MKDSVQGRRCDLAIMRALAFGRRWAALWLCCGGLAANAADFETPDKTEARHLACVQREFAPQLVASEAHAPRLLRARMVFKPGQAEPAVELLWSQLDTAGTAQMVQYLRSYRMPCLAAGEVPSAIVQEFWLRPGQRLPEAGALWPSAADAGEGSCYQAPKSDLDVRSQVSDRVNVLVYFRYPAEGGETQVETVNLSRASKVARAVGEHVRQYRPCASRAVYSGWHRQMFSFTSDDKPGARFTPSGLMKFLGLVRGVETLRARFDTSTMACPFKARWTHYQPVRGNTAESVGEHNVNREALLGWLGSLRLELPPATEMSLFGESMEIEIPCLVLEIAPEPSPS